MLTPDSSTIKQVQLLYLPLIGRVQKISKLTNTVVNSQIQVLARSCVDLASLHPGTRCCECSTLGLRYSKPNAQVLRWDRGMWQRESLLSSYHYSHSRMNG